jgi:hypothetical protein
MIVHKISKIIVGIDPGLAGGIATLTINDKLEVLNLDVIDMPTAKRKKGKKIETIIDIPALSSYMQTQYWEKQILLNAEVIVVIEKQQAMPGQGVTSMFKTGFGFGLLVGMFDRFGPIIITPKTWQSSLFPILTNLSFDTKENSINLVRKLYPSAPLIPVRCRVPKDGRADAINIAHYKLVGLRNERDGVK